MTTRSGWLLRGGLLALLLPAFALFHGRDGSSRDACTRKPYVRPAAVPPAGAARSGRDVFAVECSGCHGDSGRGDGPAAAHLPRRPADLTSGRFKLRSRPAAAGVDPQDVLDTIAHGSPAGAMPGFGFLPLAEQRAVAGYVLSLSGGRAPVPGAPRPLPHRVTPQPELIARGARIFRDAGCVKCHAAGAPGVDATVRGPDLARDRIGGQGGLRALRDRIAHGVEGTAMPAFSDALPEGDIRAVATYVEELRSQIAGPAADAESLIAAYGCRGCHVIAKRGGEVGPSLDRATRRLRTSWLRRWLTDPREPGKIYPDRHFRMPDLKLPPAAVEALIAHLRALGGREPGAEPVAAPAPDPLKVARGEALYRRTCAACHTFSGVIPSTRAPTGPDLARTAERIEYDWLLRTIITEGLRGQDADDVRVFVWKHASAIAPPRD